jgi:hypothetical protein
MINTEILKIKGDWQEVVDDCRATVGKESLGKEPSRKFKREILIAEHSPIRDIIVKWRWRDMPHWVTVHWVRHKWEKFVRTQRTDRTGVPRDKLPQDEPQTFTGEANTQALIDTMRKRLCRQASEETRQYAENLKMTLWHNEPEIADVLVPNCVYRCGCPEMNPCTFWGGFLKWCKEHDLDDPRTMSIAYRYAAYNAYFDGVIVREHSEKRESK